LGKHEGGGSDGSYHEDEQWESAFQKERLLGHGPRLPRNREWSQGKVEPFFRWPGSFLLEVVFNGLGFPIGFATLVAPPNPTRVAGNHAKNCSWTRTHCAENSSASSNSRT
jgi:hypothetical protein